MATTFEEIYSQFFETANDCNLAQLSDEDLEDKVENWLIRAVADFRFPYISLEYDLGNETFIEDLTQREINVILALMKKYFMEYQLSDGGKMRNQYYDGNIRIHSPGNLLAEINAVYKTFRKEAQVAQYNYGRVNEDGDSSLGDIDY